MNSTKAKRNYIASEIDINSWNDLEKYYDDLLHRNVESALELELWMKNRSELEAFIEENAGWRYIRMTCNTADQSFTDAYNVFVTQIEPHISLADNMLDNKFLSLINLPEFAKEKYSIVIRSIVNRIKLFREENLEIISELQVEQNEYATISGAMLINYEGVEYTMQQASKFLFNTNREIRKTVYDLIFERRTIEINVFNDLLTSLIKKRHQIAVQTGYNNYRDFRLDELGRFDYSAEDCIRLHESIAKQVMPLIHDLDRNRKNRLNLEQLKPFDLDVDENLMPPLKPFETADELVRKTIACFHKIKPQYADYIRTMNESGYLDLESRKNKAPGGYNYPLYESNIPFIFMNSTGTLRDLTTMVHEGGHAIHSFLSANLELVEFKELTSEIAELASMSMELISMEHWDVFFPDETSLKRAKKEQLEGIIRTLPWVARIDAFQHWLYLNPTHSIEDRIENWIRISKKFGSEIIDWQGYEWSLTNMWQKQLHIFEVPFYYIEYGIAQLGAIAIWRNYKQDPQNTLLKYETTLKAGYSKPIPEIYELAGIKFDFSEDNIQQLFDFVGEELKKLE